MDKAPTETQRITNWGLTFVASVGTKLPGTRAHTVQLSLSRPLLHPLCFHREVGGSPKRPNQSLCRAQARLQAERAASGLKNTTTIGLLRRWVAGRAISHCGSRGPRFSYQLGGQYVLDVDFFFPFLFPPEEDIVFKWPARAYCWLSKLELVFCIFKMRVFLPWQAWKA